MTQKQNIIKRNNIKKGSPLNRSSAYNTGEKRTEFGIQNFHETATATSAYITQMERHCTIRVKNYDYKKTKEESGEFVLYTEFLLPDHVTNEFKNNTKPEKFWRTAELFEIPFNTNFTAKNDIYTIPNSLPNELKIELCKEFVKDIFVKKGITCELSVCTKKTKQGKRQTGFC